MPQVGLEEARSSQLEALVGGLRGAAYRAASDSRVGTQRALGAESKSNHLQIQVPSTKQVLSVTSE
jgi:hypothetical protein